MHRAQPRFCRPRSSWLSGIAIATVLLIAAGSRAQSSQPAKKKSGCHTPAGQLLEEPTADPKEDGDIQAPLDRPGFRKQRGPRTATNDACQTCGVGLVAIAVTATSPVSVLVAMGLLAASQTGMVSSDPIEPYGLPLWGFGLACAGTHLFFAGITSLAFGRDMWALCNGSGAERQEQVAEVCPDGSEIPAPSSQPAVPF